jgi:hypothetical protein
MKKPHSDQDEKRLAELFQAYRMACPAPAASVHFVPELWAKIEARQVSMDWFGRVARTLVTAALAASAILGLLISPLSQRNAFFDGTFVEALRADQTAPMEPLHLDRIYQLEGH